EVALWDSENVGEADQGLQPRRLPFLPALDGAPVHVHAPRQLLVRPAAGKPRFADPLSHRLRRQRHSPRYAATGGCLNVTSRGMSYFDMSPTAASHDSRRSHSWLRARPLSRLAC